MSSLDDAFDDSDFSQTRIGHKKNLSSGSNPAEHESKIGEDGPIVATANFRSLFHFSKKDDVVVLAIAVILTIAAGAIRPTIAIFLGRNFDQLVAYGAGETSFEELLHGVSIWALALTILGLVTWLLNSTFFSMWLLFGERQARNAREKIFAGMLLKEMEWFDMQDQGLSSVLIRIQTQIRELQIACSQPFGYCIELGAAAAVATGIAFWYSWNLTLVLLASVPILLCLTWLATRRLGSAVEAQKNNLTVASQHAYTAFTAIDTVKGYNAQEQEVRQFKMAISRAAKFYMIQARATSMQMGWTRFMTVMMFVQAFWYGRHLVDHGLSAGSVLTTFYSVLTAMQAVETLLSQWMVLVKGMSAGQDLRAIVSQDANIKSMVRSGHARPMRCFGDVEIRNVCFSHASNPTMPILQDVSMFFPDGETTFVVGRSGSGKSTLGNLIMSFYEPSSGEISIDGHRVEDLDLLWLRQNITLVQQQAVLFDMTLLDNLILGGTDSCKRIDREQVNAVCSALQLQRTIDTLPHGLETLISTAELSGGQRQRILLARAQLRDTPILVLDEVTSALDPLNRVLVMNRIRTWRRGKTTIIVTHDLSQIQAKDFVYVLDSGRVIQEGYCDKLVQDEKGLFAALALSSNTPTMKRSTQNESVMASRYPPNPPDFAVHSATPEPEYPGSVSHRVVSTSSMLYTNNAEGSVSETFVKGAGVARDGCPRTDRDTTTDFLRRRASTPSARLEEMLSFAALKNTRPFVLRQRFPRTPPELDGDLELQECGKPVFDVGHCTNPELTATSRLSRNHPSVHSPEYNTIVTQDSREKESSQDLSMYQILATVWPLLKTRDRWVLIQGLGYAVINAAATPIFSYVLSNLLNTYYMPVAEAGTAQTWAMATIAVAVIDGLSAWRWHCCLEHCGEAWIDTLRVQALDRILAQPRSWFDHEEHDATSLSACLDRNAEEMRNLLGRFAGYVIIAVSMVSIAVIWSFVVCWKITLVGLASAPVIFITTRLFEAISAKWERKSNDRAAVTNSIFMETFTNIRVVRALAAEHEFLGRHHTAGQHVYKIGKQRAWWSGFFFGLSDSTNSFVTALILYYGASLVASGTWSVRDIILVMNLLLFSSGNAGSISSFIPQMASSKTTATAMLRFASLPSTTSHESLGRHRLIDPLPIQFSNLSFTYESRPNKPVLDRVSLRFEANTFTALVGSSGSGKSTIASLLLGLYPPVEPSYQHGANLSFARVSVSHVNLPSLRQAIALVPQTPILFPSTVYENIIYGLSETSPYRSIRHAIRAAQQAQIHEFIDSLPSAYSTMIGEGGLGLSGGQAQRIVIARALVRNPKVLVLDEATSALDAESAKLIRETVRRLVSTTHIKVDTLDPSHQPAREARRFAWKKGYGGNGTDVGSTRQAGMAVICITHNIEMMRSADRVVVLDEGKVVEEGTFEELSRNGLAFRRLLGRDLEHS